MLRLKRTPEWETAIGQWQIAPPFQEKVEVGELDIHLVGLSAQHPTLGEVTGSAAELDRHPFERAHFELVERISVLEAMQEMQGIHSLLDRQGEDSGRRISHEVAFPSSASPDYAFAKSNGVALHRTWDEACRHAAYELVERHLILSSWVGLTRPFVTMEGAGRSPLNALRSLYEIKRVHFGAQAVSCLKQPLIVSAVALLPRDPASPLVLAFGAAESSKESLDKAEAEVIQRLGFLWGEALPNELPEFAPTNLYHQDYHLHPAQRDKIEGWLSGAFYRNPLGSGATDIAGHRPLNIQFLDLSRYRSRGYYVAKAHCPEAIPLVFGKWRAREFANLPESLLIHPIA